MDIASSDYQLDNLDRQILSYLVRNARTPFTEIAKELIVSPGTIHGRVKRMEEHGIIKKFSVGIDYKRMGYGFTAYLGIYLDQTSESVKIMQDLKRVPEVTVAHLITGQYSIFCKIRTRDTDHAKDIIYKINGIEGIVRTESMISLEETINDSVPLISSIFTNPGE